MELPTSIPQQISEKSLKTVINYTSFLVELGVLFTTLLVSQWSTSNASFINMKLHLRGCMNYGIGLVRSEIKFHQKHARTSQKVCQGGFKQL